jgi:hypothetical protein
LDQEGEETGYTVNLNGEEVQVVIRLRAELGGLTVPGAEDDKVRVTKTVECDNPLDGTGDFDDDCAAIPRNLSPPAVARYTIFLEQVSPNTSEGLTVLYDELDSGFSYISGSATSPDGSIAVFEPTNVGSQQSPILMWDYLTTLGDLVYFQQQETKMLQFKAEISGSTGRYCNAVYLKPNREKSGKTAPIVVGGSSAGGCGGAGVSLVKYVDRLVAPPNELTVLTYLVNVENVDTNTLHIDSIKDVLPQGGFTYVPGSTLVKITSDTTFDFEDTTGFVPFSDVDLATEFLPSERWQLIWDGPGGAGWGISAAGGASDTIILRFSAAVTPISSGSYYNEAFIGVGSGCSAPQNLVREGVFTPGQEDEEYCTAYSWPTGGVTVPTYDVRSGVGSTTAQGNVDVDWSGGVGDVQLNSWHIN